MRRLRWRGTSLASSRYVTIAPAFRDCSSVESDSKSKAESGAVGTLRVWMCNHESYDQEPCEMRFMGMLLIIAILLLLFWGGGFAFHVAGGLIHILLIIALVVFILHFVRGGKKS